MRMKWMFGFLCLLLVCAVASAQTVTGTLSGHVTDKTGAMVPKATITAVNTSTGGTRDAATNAEGYYQLTFLPLGTYDVTVTMSGFRGITKKGVEISLNTNTVSDFALEVAPVTQAVQVEGGETPLIDTTSGEVKNTLNDVIVGATPIAGRNFISLVEQIPGFQPVAFDSSSNNPTNSTGSYAAFSGQGTRSSTFQIDGVNNDDSSENQNRQGVNISTIKEVQVLTNAYSAEFGRAGGAVVLVQTKQGTNRFHGDAYDFIQNDIFNANDYFLNQTPGATRPPVRRNQYGGTVGGPVLKNKLFFFGSFERVRNVASGSMSRFVWLPTDGPRLCAAGEHPAPKGPYCVDPTTHPNAQRDLTFIKSVMSLWNTPELQGKTPNDPAACSRLIASGRPNRCVRVGGLISSQPQSDYTGRFDWNTNSRLTQTLRYQYSRQLVTSGRIIFGDNFGTNNNRQYNLGYTLTWVFSPRQTGEFRYGYGNRNTNQQVTDANNHTVPITPTGDNQLPIIRFGGTTSTLVDPSVSSDTIASGGTVIGTSTNVPINRYQRDHQFVYNHTLVLSKHTLRAGIDQRFQALDDVASGTQRGFWTFGVIDSTASVAAGNGFTSWENFLDGVLTAYNIGYGLPFAQNRFGETNLYLEDSYRFRPNLTLNLGVRWEGVRAPHEIKNRFNYGYGGDWNNVEPRLGIAWSPAGKGFLQKITGGAGDFVIRAGGGLYHDRVFQSIFSQSGLNFRFQPPNGFLLSTLPNPCSANPGATISDPAGNPTVIGAQLEISDPTCGFKFTPGTASRSIAGAGGGVNVAGGQLQTSLLLPDPKFHLPYVEQWNVTVERKLPSNTAFSVTYNGNRGIGLPFFSGVNDAMFPIVSPLVTVDVGGGNLQHVVFDRVCKDFTDPICVTTTSTGAVNPASSGIFKAFSALTSTSATLAQKGIVIVNGVPHGYISLGSSASERIAERRPDPTNGRNVRLSNFAYTYYNAMTMKLTRMSHGLTLTGWWTWSKTMDTGSEATFTGTDVNAPVGAANPQRSLRALSSFDQPNRVVISAAYELPWMKTRYDLLGQIVGGWSISGVGTFASGLPFTVLSGYDENFDGVGGDLPVIVNPKILGTSIDKGRPQASCPSALVAGRCLDSQSQLQLPASAFLPFNLSSGDQFPIAPGQDFPGGVARRNSFFQQGQKNIDGALAKSFRIRERASLQLRMELYNVFNRVTFAMPSARTVNSTTPLGRITGDINLSGYVNAARPATSARQGQFAIRLTF